jgi:hypothetical protein
MHHLIGLHSEAFCGFELKDGGLLAFSDYLKIL